MKLHPLVAKILVSRGITSEKQAADFFDVSLSHLHDPFLLRDMDLAVKRIEKALAGGEKITIYGDYDVDGITSTSILYLYLRAQGAMVDYYIPERSYEGYGLNKTALDQIIGRGSTLLITVDCGITAVDECGYAAGCGMDVIITDHHECAEQLPPAVAVINPKREDHTYPFDALAGVGVAFKLICALAGPQQLGEVIRNYLEIVCIGTIADVMPLTGENKIIVSHGLHMLGKSRYPGVRALLYKLGIKDQPVSSGTIGYMMAPRINAAGRVSSPMRAVDLFLATERRQAEEIVEQLFEYNRRRQEMENQILAQAGALIKADADFADKRIIVLAGESWHQGVIGIVASRLCEKYGLPVILITFANGMGRASGRSIPGFNLYQACSENKRYLARFGGHELAVGFSIERENLAAFEQGLQQSAKAYFLTHEQELTQRIELDVSLDEADLTMEAAKALQSLEPFGTANPVPVFEVRDACIEDIVPIGNNKHIRLNVRCGARLIQALYFGMAAGDFPYACGDLVTLACNMDINTYRGKSALQLLIRAIRMSDSYAARLRSACEEYRCYCRDGVAGSASALVPLRADFIAVYRYISQERSYETGQIREAPELIWRKFNYKSGQRFSYIKFRVILDIFAEMKIVKIHTAPGQFALSLPARGGMGKVNLADSNLFAALKARSRQER